MKVSFALIIVWYYFFAEAIAPSSALPLGATRKVDETRTSKMEPTTGLLLYSVLAVSWATEEARLIDSNIAGYVYVYITDH